MTDRELLELIAQKVNELDQKFSGLGQKLTGMEQDIKLIKNQTAELTEFRTEANEKLDILIDIQKSINEILGRHDIEIQTLKRKIS